MSTKSKTPVKSSARTIKNVATKSKSVNSVSKEDSKKSKKSKKSNRNTIAVIQLTPRGRRIRKYNSMSDAERATGVNTGSISKVVRGIMKTAGGFVWANA
jgi:hypothetical protein